MEKVFFMEVTKEPLYVQLYTAIVDEIRSGTLKVEDRLPSVRDLSKTMNLSKTTVENAYNQLVAEGYIYSKPQVGYFVIQVSKVPYKFELIDTVDELPTTSEYDKTPFAEKKGVSDSASTFDFVSEYVEPSNFDMSLWKRNINYILSHEDATLFSAASPFGEALLREEICDYFTRTRGIKALPHQIIISSGTSSLLRELAHVFKVSGYNTFGIENPGYNVAKEVFSQADYLVKPISLKNKVLDMKSVCTLGTSVIFTSPSYQFPYGEIMPVQTRYDLLDYATTTKSYIIEDDYNNELRYIGRPVTALQGMDSYGRVIYLGSFSTILLPSIKISFMVLPVTLVKVYNKIFKDKIQGASKLEQLALAQMIKTGDFSRHIRKLRKNYRVKHHLLLELCVKHLETYCYIDLPPAGLMAILVLKRKVSIEELKVHSKKIGLGISIIQDFMVKNSEQVDYTQTLVLNYRGIRATDLEQGLIRVKELLCQL